MNLICVAVFACCLGVPALGQGENLVQLAEKLGAKTLVQFVQDAGLADTLANGGRYCYHYFIILHNSNNCKDNTIIFVAMTSF